MRARYGGAPLETAPQERGNPGSEPRREPPQPRSPGAPGRSGSGRASCSCPVRPPAAPRGGHGGARRRFGGPLELGIGRGYRPHEFAGFGVDIKHRKAMTDEGLEILRRAWSGEPFSFSGVHYQVKDAHLAPLPVQRPHPPVWLGAATAKSRRQVAEGGYPLLISLITNLAETPQELGDYTKSLLRCGRDPARYPRALIREFYVAECRYRDHAGIENVILRMQFPGQAMEQVMRSLELLASEVIPRVEA